MKRRVFLSIFGSCVLVLLLTATALLASVRAESIRERKAELRAEALRFAAVLNSSPDTSFELLAALSDRRLTLVAADGTVLFDTGADADELASHQDRPEIAEAAASGEGEATRSSETLGVSLFYRAVRLEDGRVLRLAASLGSVAGVIDRAANYIAIGLVCALALALIAARVLTKRIIAPINGIDPEHPLRNAEYAELSPLLLKLDRQKREIAARMAELSAKQREFALVTDGMSEALVLFGADKTVLQANSAARRLFSAASPEGLDSAELCRDAECVRALGSAFAGERAEARLEKDGRVYRLAANPAGEGGGAALYAIDVTSSERAEQMRREFTANVSHELRTPLTSILAGAELISSGAVKQEDLQRFAGRIYGEARRLLSLIEDIIRLSRLDEGELEGEFAPVELHSLAARALASLASKAEREGVALSLEGDEAAVSGIESTLLEMVYNLCDNAITYNRPGGHVRVSVAREGGGAVLSVRDDGIGIAPEERERVFERFYRVDKSRSRSAGGTGLGLSIVKHGAALHGASVALESALGSGTCVTLRFFR